MDGWFRPDRCPFDGRYQLTLTAEIPFPKIHFEKVSAEAHGVIKALLERNPKQRLAGNEQTL